MAIKIRCSECSKKISIDEAFAGGACRCPYCKAIVMVPGEAQGVAPGRPTAPRPDAPGDVAAQSAAAVPEDVPMADPVRVQSYVAVGLIALLILAMIAGVVVLLVHLKGCGEKPEQARNEFGEVAVPANPFETKIGGASVAGDVKIEAPVVYVIACGSSMGTMMDMSAKIVSVSVRTLKNDQKFTAIMALPPGGSDHPGTVKLPPGAVMFQNDMVGGGGAAAKDVLKFMTDLLDTPRNGVVDVGPAIKAALAMNPKTVVVFTRNQIEGGEALAAEAQKAGIKLVTMGMDAEDDVKDNLKKISDAAQSETRTFSAPMLDTWVSQFKNEE